jgi:ABC-type nickel/cobalt efflux system permease component RcnA
VDFGKLIGELTKDWEWLSFLARYCAGKNIGKSFCDDVRWWALGIAALVVVIVAWWIWGRLARAYESWRHRRLVAKVADSETMKEHVWAGHDAHLPSADQRANRK